MPSAATSRPQLKPGLRQVWRDAGTVQIGLTPEAGVIVAGLCLRRGRAGRPAGRHPAGERAGRGARRRRAWTRPGCTELIAVLDAAGVLTGPPTDRAYLHQLGPDRADLARTRRPGPWSTPTPVTGSGCWPNAPATTSWSVGGRPGRRRRAGRRWTTPAPR